MTLVRTFGICVLALTIGWSAGCAKKKTKTAADSDDKNKTNQVANKDPKTAGNSGKSPNKSTFSDTSSGKTSPEAIQAGNKKTDKQPVAVKTTGNNGDIKKPGKIENPSVGAGKKGPDESGSGAKRKLSGPKPGDQD